MYLLPNIINPQIEHYNMICLIPEADAFSKLLDDVIIQFVHEQNRPSAYNFGP